MSDLDLDALEASYTNTSRIAEKDVYALIAEAREAEHRTEERDAIERPMTEIAEMLGCDDVDDMPGAVRRVIEEGKDVAQMLVDRERLADEQHTTLTADLDTARAQLAMAREALERLSALTPGAANSATPRDLHLTVKAIADTALAQLSEAPK